MVGVRMEHLHLPVGEPAGIGERRPPRPSRQEERARLEVVGAYGAAEASVLRAGDVATVDGDPQRLPGLRIDAVDTDGEAGTTPTISR